jgi:hypothetical protein
MLNLEQDQQLFDKKQHTNKAPSQWGQYLVMVKDHEFHTIDWFQDETKVLELQPIHIVNKWDTCSTIAHLLMID